MPFRPKNSRNWHYDFQIRGCRFHGSCETENYEKAKAVEAEKRVEAKNSFTAVKPEVFTLSQALGTYYSDVAQHQTSARTARAQATALLKFLAPETCLTSLKSADIQRFVSRRRARCANATVNRELQLLGRAMRHMSRVHGAALPALDLKGFEIAEPEERIRELTGEEQTRLFAELREDLHPLVTMALATGLRRSELTAMRWSDVDFNTGRLRVVQKGGRTRHFPINRELQNFLKSLPRAKALPHATYVLTYVNRKATGQPRHRFTQGGGIMGVFRAALAEAEIENFRFHDLRHTFATRLLRQTGNLKLVSRLLGHSDIATTMRYAHVLDEDLRNALEDYRVDVPVPNKLPKRHSRH